MQLFRTAFIFILLIASGIAQSSDYPLYIENFTRNLHQTMLNCPDRTWPGFNFQKVQALLVDNKTEQAWLWNDLKDNLEITTIPFINIPPAAKSYYSFLKWNGFNTVSVAVNTTDTDPDDMLRTLVHEAFHHYEQKDWNIPSSGWRTLTYPVDWKLRYFRRMSLLSLFKAYSFSTSLERAEAIKAATYWDHLVKETDSNDYQQNVGLDLVEGSASYTDIVTSALARKGCLAAEPDLRTEILGRANEFFGILKVDQYGLDATWAAEPYDIGALSGLILRETAVVDWENRLKIDGTSPFTLLAQIYGQSVHEEDNLAMKDLMISKAKAYNLELVKVLGPIASGMTSANFLRVALPTKMQQGAIRIKGLIRVATIPEGIVMIQTSFQALSATSNMAFTEQSIVRADKTPCGDNQTVFVVSPADFPMAQDQTFKIQNLNVRGQGKASLVTDSRGLQWACVD